MKVIRANLQQSFNAYKEDQIITCPVKGHPGYFGLMEAKQGDIIIAATHDCSVGAISIVSKDAYIGDMDYYKLGGRLSEEKRITVETRVLAFCNLRHSDFEEIFSKDVFTCPFFAYVVLEFDKKKLKDLVNSQILIQKVLK